MENALICEAIEKDDVPTLAALLSKTQLDLNAIHVRDWILLRHAMTGYANKVVQYLLLNHITINMKDFEGNTPLHLAVQANNPEAVTLLLTQKAIEINAKNNACLTPLYLAVSQNLITIAEQLINSGSNINEPDQYGQTALHIASWNGHIELIEKLLDCEEINANQQDNSGDTFLHLAAQRGFSKVCNLPQALKKCDINLKNNEARTALDTAILLNSSSDMAELLLRAGTQWGETSQYLLFEWCLTTQNKSLFKHGLLAGLNTSLDTRLEKQLPDTWLYIQQPLNNPTNSFKH